MKLLSLRSYIRRTQLLQECHRRKLCKFGYSRNFQFGRLCRSSRCCKWHSYTLNKLYKLFGTYMCVYYIMLVIFFLKITSIISWWNIACFASCAKCWLCKRSIVAGAAALSHWWARDTGWFNLLLYLRIGQYCIYIRIKSKNSFYFTSITAQISVVKVSAISLRIAARICCIAC